MRYGSICSGVEAVSLAWKFLGWEAVFFAEVEPFPSAVLMQRFGATKPMRPLDPETAQTEKERKQRENWKKQIKKLPDGGTIPNLGDFTKIKKEDYDGEIDLLVGGCPCQSYSIAGLRKGLDDPRGNLSLEFAKLAFRSQTRWVLYENVPGLLSQGKGEAFAEILSALCGWKVEVPVFRRKKNGDIVRGWKNSGIVTPAPGGYGLAWRTLDAQFVRVDGFPRAVPQRRRRLFIVGYSGNWARAAAVLFDEESLSGDSPPERKKRQGTACGFEVGPYGGRKSEVSSTLDSRCKDGAIRNQTGMLCMAHGQGNAEVLKEKSPTLNCNHEVPIICRECGQGYWKKDEAAGPVKTNGSEPTTVVCYDARGNGKGDIVPNLTGCHASRTNDYMPLVVQDCVKRKSYGIAENIINRKAKNGGNGKGFQEELQYTLNTVAPHGVCCFVKNDAARDYSKDVAMTLRGQAEHAVSYKSTVRRLTPVECERLMGFPDNHTRIKWRGKSEKECPDSHRYKACGNSMAVNVMRWIGTRIQILEDFINE